MKIVFQMLFFTCALIACNPRNETDARIEKAQSDSIAKIKQDSANDAACATLLKDPGFEMDTATQILASEPKNLWETLRALNSFFNPKQKEWIACVSEKGFRNQMLDNNFAMYLRNYWGLWGDYKNNPLVRDFYRMGVWHPDDMSVIILISYHRLYNNRNIRLKEQIEELHIWYRETYRMPVDSLVYRIQRLAQDS
ncbi:MAG: hypothetical protein BWY70_01598 [Bacteroidetes bacterium ADurb.Bin408]|nr:MAG: hypothetical protein BWY70_01598 [Bacteroidetes bacterium ADurb.Bin408]